MTVLSQPFVAVYSNGKKPAAETTDPSGKTTDPPGQNPVFCRVDGFHRQVQCDEQVVQLVQILQLVQKSAGRKVLVLELTRNTSSANRGRNRGVWHLAHPHIVEPCPVKTCAVFAPDFEAGDARKHLFELGLRGAWAGAGVQVPVGFDEPCSKMCPFVDRRVEAVIAEIMVVPSAPRMMMSLVYGVWLTCMISRSYLSESP